VWDADAGAAVPAPRPGRSRAGAGADAEALLAEMRDVAERIEELRARQLALLAAGKEQGLEIAPMAKALGISRQTAYSWLGA
jgi:transcriptional regulator of acetoin/glycerol metabolism